MRKGLHAVIRSMTGFGEASTTHEEAHYHVEVRTLNAKYFKAVIRLPEQIQALEAELESVLRSRLGRGTITLTVSITDDSPDAAFDINHRALDRYVEQLRRSSSVGEGLVPLDAAALLSLPGVLQPPADEEDRLHRARDAVLDLVERACGKVVEMREHEGRGLRQELVAQRERVDERLNEIAGRAPAVVEEYQARLEERIRSLLSVAGVSSEDVDIMREVAAYAERSDINEEVVRLRGHMEQFGELISQESAAPIGRTLDFLCQEMLREANTIASKSSDGAISRDIVMVKGAIDRIKELVQNVE